MWLLLLDVASAAPDLERIARDAVAGRADLPPGALVSAVRIPQGDRGSVIRLGTMLDGDPVDLDVRVWLGPDGAVREVRADRVPPRRIDGVPISAARAREIASAHLPPGPVRLRRAWQADPSALRRVWTVESELPRAGLLVPRVRLDAVTGGLLSIDDAASTDLPRAGAWVHNPVVDGNPLAFALPFAAEALADERLAMFQCRDIGERVEWKIDAGTVSVHRCTQTPAAGPIDGDYLFESIPWPANPARDEDDFVAGNVYWNVHRGLDWFESLGWAPADDFEPALVVTVNQRDPDLWSTETATDPEAALLPFDNAYSAGGFYDDDGDWASAVLVFGQGREIDYGYDADVVHHELGHYIVRSVHGPSWSPDSSWGPSVRASTLNEGLADYFSSAIHGEGLLGEYAAGSTRSEIRDLSGDATCSTDLWGESHYDSLPFSQPLWQLRETLSAGARATLDAAVLDSLAQMGKTPDFADATGILLGLVRERLGAETAADLEARWAARGALDCPPVIDIVPGTEPLRRLALVRGSYPSANFGAIPGYLQYRVQIPEGGARLTLRFLQTEFLGLDLYGDNFPLPLGVVGRSGETLTWSWHDREVKLPDADGHLRLTTVVEWVSDGARVGSAIDTRSTLSSDGEDLVHEYVVYWDVAEPGPWVFQLVNDWPRSATAYDPTLGMTPIPPVPGRVWLSPEADCGCAAGGHAPASLLGLLGIVAIACRRPSLRRAGP